MVSLGSYVIRRVSVDVAIFLQREDFHDPKRKRGDADIDVFLADASRSCEFSLVPKARQHVAWSESPRI